MVTFFARSQLLYVQFISLCNYFTLDQMHSIRLILHSHFVALILSFVFIAGYQAFFTLNIGLAVDPKTKKTVYEYASLTEEVIPTVVKS